MKVPSDCEEEPVRKLDFPFSLVSQEEEEEKDVMSDGKDRWEWK